MAITYGFFNSVNGDRKYNSDQMSTYFEGLVSDGVYESVGDKLQVKALSDMQIGVQSGRALIGSKWIKNDAVETINIAASHVLLNRYTAIVIRLDLTNREITIAVKDGENATDAVRPTMTDSVTTKELCLAYVYVKAGATAITQADIADMRGSSVCPWVTGLVKQVDTSELFLQYQTAYEEQLAAMETWKQAQQTAFETWLASLTEPLQMNIVEYRNIVHTTEDTTELTIGISAYNPNSDILYANINGVMFVKGEDYTISGTGSAAKIVFTNRIFADNTVEFRVLKATVGQVS